MITSKFDKDGKPTKESWLDAETFEVVKLKQEIAELKAKIEELKNPTPEEPKLKVTVVHDSKESNDPVEIIPKVRKSI